MTFFFSFSSWSRSFKPTKISLVLFSFIGKDLEKRSHPSQQPLQGCVCECEWAEPQRARPCQVCQPSAHPHPHTSLPGCHPQFRIFCTRLSGQYSAIANCVCLLIIVCGNIFVEKNKNNNKKKKTGFSRVLVPPGYLLSIFVITYL